MFKKTLKDFANVLHIRLGKKIYGVSYSDTEPDVLPLQQEKEQDYFPAMESSLARGGAKTDNIESVIPEQKSEAVSTGDEKKSKCVSTETDNTAVLSENNDVSSREEIIPKAKESSKLDNKPWLKLLTDVVRLGDELDTLREKIPPEAGALAEHIAARLDEMLDRNGAEAIESGKLYDVRRHQAVPPRLVPDGSEIESILRPGWCVAERVLRRAKVKIVNQEN